MTVDRLIEREHRAAQGMTKDHSKLWLCLNDDIDVAEMVSMKSQWY